MTKTYFLPPDFLSYPAATDTYPGAIRLGHLIADIDDPSHAISTLPPLPMEGYNMPIGNFEGTGMGHTDNTSSSIYAKLFLKAVSLVKATSNIDVQTASKLLSAMEKSSRKPSIRQKTTWRRVCSKLMCSCG